MSSPLLEDLNQRQREAVKQTDGPILILAGAGSGKTRVLTHKIAHLITEQKAQPEDILALTFTNKAAGEMKERIQNLLIPDSRFPTPDLPFAGTFHSFCARILRKEGKALGFPPGFLIYDEGDQKEVIKEAMKNLDISTKNYNPSAVLATIGQAKNELLSALEYLQYARGHFQETAAKIYLTYQKILKENAALDFDDLLLETVRLFQKEPPILTRYQNRFRYILIDEYQDTNRAQYALGKLLAGRWRNICVVGDASQSIYSWRGADFRNLMSFKNDFPDLKVFNLEQNYRSTQKILDAAYHVILRNTSHPILKLWTQNPPGEKINLYESPNEHEEAEFIINQIASHAMRHKPALPTGRPYALSNFAIFYRTNAQSRILEETLLRAGLPYALVGGTRFYERREIKDVLAYLRLLVNPKDTVSYKRIEKLGKARLQKFLGFAGKLDYSNIKKELPTLEILDELLAKTGYLELYDPKVEEDLTRLENIKELRSVATEFPDPTNFLENVALVEQEYYPDNPVGNGEKKNTVTLMTLHAAKGLEFPVVFIIGMEEGLFPHSRSLLDPQELEEERRLCYVGMTRAKEKLYLTYARRRLFFGQRTSNTVSRFIGEIPQHLLSFQ
ncbi:MAG: UvrD-helicase domain-containing protein [bacterium]|nr:UvrD-helicase domain-containing protein [bacterium]